MELLHLLELVRTQHANEREFKALPTLFREVLDQFCKSQHPVLAIYNEEVRCNRRSSAAARL